MDINEMFDIDELQEQNKPTLEEIKKIVDSKRLKVQKHEHHLKHIRKKIELKI